MLVVYNSSTAIWDTLRALFKLGVKSRLFPARCAGLSQIAPSGLSNYQKLRLQSTERKMGRYFMNITLVVLTFLLLGPCAPGNLSRAQSCNPAVVNYIVRDEGGKVLSAAELKSIFEQLPKSIGDARL